MKPNKHKLKEKKLRSVAREFVQLGSRRDKVVVKLDEPYTNGFLRMLVPKKVLANPKWRPALDRLLAKFYSPMFCRFGTFDPKRYRPAFEGFPIISWSDYDKFELGVLPVSLFMACEGQLHGCKHLGRVVSLHYHVNPESAARLLDVKIAPKIITHVVIPDGDMETRKTELKHFMDNCNGWRLMDNLVGNKNRHDGKGFPIRDKRRLAAAAKELEK
jgi:hypothetical protein